MKVYKIKVKMIAEDGFEEVRTIEYYDEELPTYVRMTAILSGLRDQFLSTATHNRAVSAQTQKEQKNAQKKKDERQRLAEEALRVETIDGKKWTCIEAIRLRKIKEIARRIPTYDFAKMCGAVRPGRDYRGCTKRAMCHSFARANEWDPWRDSERLQLFSLCLDWQTKNKQKKNAR